MGSLKSNSVQFNNQLNYLIDLVDIFVDLNTELINMKLPGNMVDSCVELIRVGIGSLVN